MQKKIITFLLVLCLSIVMVTPCMAAETRDKRQVAKNNDVIENQFTGVEEIPKEVRDRVNELQEFYPNAEIEIISPEDETLSTYSTSSSWGTSRKYKGYTIKDWNVKIDNSFDMTRIANDANATDFCGNMLVYAGQTLLDTIIPFSSAGMTAIQYFTGTSNVVTAKDGYKLNAAPSYITYEKFTYVFIGDQYYLGAKSYKTNLVSVSWYLAKDSNAKTGVKSINRTYNSANYNSPDAKAVVYYGSGGYIDPENKINIGGKIFVLD